MSLLRVFPVFLHCALALNLRVNAPHLFIDLDGISTSANLSVVPGLVVKDYERPVVAGEDPWDEFIAPYSSLLLNSVGGVPTYFLYYSCSALDVNKNYVCLVTTTDGRTWVKPALTAFPWVDGRLTNRVFFHGTDFMGNVFLDDAPGVSPTQRFKLLYSGMAPNGYGGVFLATSPDGLLFTAAANTNIDLPPHYGDTQPAVVWDAVRSRYAAFGRSDYSTPNTTRGCPGGGNSVRRVLSAFSTSGAGEGYGNASVILQYGAPDQPDCLDVYNSSPLPLLDDDSNTFLFLPSSYRHFAAADSLKNSSNDGVLDVRLAFSRDGGVTAAFASREAFIPRGTGTLASPGSFSAPGSDSDAGVVYATAGGLVDPDKLMPPPRQRGRRTQGSPPYAVPSPRVWLLFYGSQRTHAALWFPSGPIMDVSVDPGFNGILRGSLRREGFAGLRTPAGDPIGAGAFNTAPLLVPQPAIVCSNATAQLWLLLNVQTSVAGGASVALLMPDSLAPIPGRGPADALPFVGDNVRAPASWASDATGAPPVRDLSPFAGTQVVVSVTLVHAHLFSWVLQCV